MASITIQEVCIPPHRLSGFEQDSKVAEHRSMQQLTGPRDVYADFNYYVDPQDGTLPEPLEVTKPSSFLDKPKDVRTLLVHDVRGEKDQYTLEKNGFQFCHHTCKEMDFLDDQQIESQYYPEVERLLKDVTGATRVHIWEHTIRREANNQKASPYTGIKSKRQQGPVRRVHIDQTQRSTHMMVQRHFPQDSERLLAGRVQIINVWRPIKPIFKDPLGVTDARSVPDGDLVPVRLIYPGNKEGETFTVKSSEGKGQEKHRWYYLYGQQPDEPLLFKCYDSKRGGNATRVPHSAFTNREEEHQDSRESIEVRCLVFHETE